MAKHVQIGARKAARTVARRARAGRSAYVMKPEYLAMLEDFRLMDDTFMSKCLENAPECIELMLRIIIGKKDLKVVKSQTEHPIKSLQGRGVRFDILKKRVSQFKNSEEGRHYMCEAMERLRSEGKAEGKREGKRETMLATAKRMIKSGMLALKDIAKFSGLSLAQVKKLQASMA